MNKASVVLLFLSITLLISCHYVKDKLIIENSTNEEIRYSTFLFDNNTNNFFVCSAGGDFNFYSNKSSPLVREPIIDLMKETSNNDTLYIVFYKESDKDYIYKNTQTIVNNKSFMTYKFPKKDLDRTNWEVKYTGKQQK